jgi:RimJ/RimL family protein N-acetyltransferase
MITTDRVLLRQWKATDREPFAHMNAEADVMRYFPHALNADESNALVDRIEAHFDEHGWGLWAAEIQGKFAGFIGLSHVTFDTGYEVAPEIGWRLASKFWHQGYATEGAKAALAYGIQELAMSRIVSFTSPHNRPSWRVMERIGMTKVGMFEHPRVPDGHPLKTQVLYEARA